MSQTNIIQPIPVTEITDSHPEISLIDILGEIQATPREYWPNLFKIITIFREAITFKSSQKAVTITSQSEVEEQIKQNQTAIELLRSWRESNDDSEQQETWEILRQAFEVKE